MSDLFKQLEDKKKELKERVQEHIYFTGISPENCERFKCVDRDEVKVLQAEIAILEQAIAEIKSKDEEIFDLEMKYKMALEGGVKALQKQRQEILDKILSMAVWGIHNGERERVVEVWQIEQLNQPKTEQ